MTRDVGNINYGTRKEGVKCGGVVNTLMRVCDFEVRKEKALKINISLVSFFKKKGMIR